MPPLVIYCYDAYCGWCYGFSPVIRKIAEEFSDRVFFEVLSGGMIIQENPAPISASADFIKDHYKTVEEYTGIRFGADYLWHIHHPEESDWFPSSEKPAIAMCIFKEIFPSRQVEFAGDLQYALHYEGRDLCDNEAYRHLLEKYGIEASSFYEKLKSEEYKEKAYYEFALVKQLRVTGFPTLLLQESESRFFLLARGYTPYDAVKKSLESALQEIGKPA